jgi:hypothetical protein
VEFDFIKSTPKHFSYSELVSAYQNLLHWEFSPKFNSLPFPSS